MLAMLLIASSTQCAPSLDVMTQALKEQFHEVLQVQGVEDDGNTVMMFGNVQTKTWTAVISDPAGQACIVGSGGDFKVIPQGDPA